MIPAGAIVTGSSRNGNDLVFTLELGVERYCWAVQLYDDLASREDRQQAYHKLACLMRVCDLVQLADSEELHGKVLLRDLEDIAWTPGKGRS